MAWTVPNGCYYAVYVGSDTFNYYAALSTVPTERSPNNASVPRYYWVLIDFNNGYIYTSLKNAIINIQNNNTFTLNKIGSGIGGYNVTNIIASNNAITYHNLTLSGSAFTFGNGSGMLNKADILPSSAEYMMSYTFAGRPVTNVTIPTGVNRLQNTFEGCTSLTTAPVIPSGVTNTTSCFYGCTALTRQVTINGSPSKYDDMFTGTVNELVITGSGSVNATIASQYANVYAWSLSSSIAAQRDESVLTSVDVSVDVTRFTTGTLTSLSLYKNGSQTPLSVTWNDPTLTITGTPTTFTTTITGIAEGDAPTISVIATDAYGSATEVSVNIPIAFYTMDVQAGGKEIAFGAIATDDLTNHPDGLFRCNMDALLVGNTTEVENPYYSLDTTASQGTTDGDLYAAITALSWQSVVQQILDVKALLTKELTLLKAHDVDYVVESGTSGGWTYRKWNSGVAEAWKRTGSKSYSMTNTVGGNGYTSDYWTLPSGLFTAINKAHVNRINGGNGLVSCSIYAVTTSRIDHYIWVTGTTGTITMELSIEVKGTWK